MDARSATPPRVPRRRSLAFITAGVLTVSLLPAAAVAQVPGTGTPTADDPRVGLEDGYDAEQVVDGMDPIGYFDKRDSPFFDPATSLSPNVGLAIGTANSDTAFIGDHVIHGNWRGFQIYDISDPSNPTLRTAALCPGGQGDVTVHGDLLFTSVEDVSARIDCGTQGAGPANEPDEDRMRGVRIWDISDLDDPVQVATVQTCRGSHTHRLVEDLDDPSRVYIYNNGTSAFRHPDEAGLNCTTAYPTNGDLPEDPVTDPDENRWQIEVIEVPLDDPGAAAIVDEVRLFQDEETGALNGLQNTQVGAQHPSGVAYSPLPNTNTCHDITVYPEIGLAAGACQGNGLLMDISDPANPVRIDEVADENFSYWHSANFSNDGSKVMFTDEWGGGTGARCRDTDRLEWGANALFDIVDTAEGKRLQFASYFKMPAIQTGTENCVAHQANIVPIPDRDIIVQAWYQGGISMFDWTDTANPREIGFFDRGPLDDEQLILGGHWSGYWYNGAIYGAEIARGLDVLELVPTEELSAREIAAAETVQMDLHNAMSMRSFQVSLDDASDFDTLGVEVRGAVFYDDIDDNTARRAYDTIDRAERFSERGQRQAAVAQLNAMARQLEQRGATELAAAFREVADSR